MFFARSEVLDEEKEKENTHQLSPSIEQARQIKIKKIKKKANKKRKENLLANHTIVQEPPVRLLPALDGIDRRPAAHLGRAGEDGAHD